MKVLLKLVVGLLIVAAIAIGGSVFYLDRLVAVAIEEVGPRVTGTAVQVDDVSLSPLGGTGEISGLGVANPPGFTAAEIFRLGRISVELDPGTLLDDVIVVRAIDVIDPIVVFEQGAAGSNLSVLRDRLASNRVDADPGAPAESGRKLVIERLTVTGARAAIAGKVVSDREISVAIPPIEMTDIGRNTGGATLAEVTEQLLRALSDSASRSVIEQNVLQQLGLNPDQVDQTRDVIEQARDRIEGVLDVFR